MRDTKPDYKPDYVGVARFRGALRAFEHAADQAARAAGLTTQRYLLLLFVKGAPDGSGRATVNEVAARLRVAPHTVTGAAARAEQAGLVVRERCTEDRRRTWIRLTAEGDRRLQEVVTALARQRDGLVTAVDDLVRGARAIDTRTPAGR